MLLSWLLDAIYLIALVLLSPWLVWRAWRTGRYRRGLGAKGLGLGSPLRLADPVWFHGVSVGEVHLLRQLVAAFRQAYPHVPCVISSTTDTGLDEARRCFTDLTVIGYPFDFSWAVRRTLRAVRPRLVVLAECELWPNFLHAARAAGVLIAVVNGRMSPRSLARYCRLGRLPRWLFGHLDLLAAQSSDYADAFRALGAAPEKVVVTGSVKYDGACGERDNAQTRQLRTLLGIGADDLVWVAGSTLAPEEDLVLDTYATLRGTHPTLRLVLVPRQRDRFDEVAALLQRRGVAYRRRSQLQAPPEPDAVILGDTLGELGALWGLADVAFVGGSLDGRRGGQNMIEPAAYGAAVLFGPHVWNFREPAARLVEVGGAVQVPDAATLTSAVAWLLTDPNERAAMGRAAQDFVRGQQGATVRTVTLLGNLLGRRGGTQAA